MDFDIGEGLSLRQHGVLTPHEFSSSFNEFKITSGCDRADKAIPVTLIPILQAIRINAVIISMIASRQEKATSKLGDLISK